MNTIKNIKVYPHHEFSFDGYSGPQKWCKVNRSCNCSPWQAEQLQFRLQGRHCIVQSHCVTAPTRPHTYQHVHPKFSLELQAPGNCMAILCDIVGYRVSEETVIHRKPQTPHPYPRHTYRIHIRYACRPIRQYIRRNYVHKF